MSDAAEIMVEHYQKTYELTFEMWRQRNRIFLVLLAVIGVATLLTFRVPEANSLFVDLIAKLLGVSDQQRIQELRQSFPFGLLQSILLTTIFYLMVNLYHRARYVLRSYSYLSNLEREIRQQLNLADGTISFTRESTFYWGQRDLLSGFVKWVYIVFLGLLLIAFLVGRIIDDFRTGSVLLAIVDLIIAIPTIIFYFGYARASVFSGTKQAIVGKDNEKSNDDTLNKSLDAR